MSKFSGLSLAVDSVARLIILDPVTRQPLRDTVTGEDAWIDMLSAAGSVGRAHDRAVTDKQLKMRGRRMTAEEMEADQIERLAKLTKAWHLVALDGQPIDVECTQANARELFSMPESAWLRDQALEHCLDAGVFQAGYLEELTAYAEHQFMLNRRSPDGVTERDNLESVERQTGRRPAALDGPELPADGAHVWAWFLALHNARGSNGFGANPISWLDVWAWRDLTGILIHSSEIEAIMALDRAWMAEQARDAAKGKT